MAQSELQFNQSVNIQGIGNVQTQSIGNWHVFDAKVVPNRADYRIAYVVGEQSRAFPNRFTTEVAALGTAKQLADAFGDEFHLLPRSETFSRFAEIMESSR
ncbi:MAG: hypothetical protein L6Q98_17780 [Anaerolineae bacterium]|nr:hypothetical protein [Anaerolineae bacterium]NUQ05942.1 hypothetical protein [Anaerolineae bacterium]